MLVLNNNCERSGNIIPARTQAVAVFNSRGFGPEECARLAKQMQSYNTGTAPFDLPFAEHGFSAKSWWTSVGNAASELVSLAVFLHELVPFASSSERACGIMGWYNNAKDAALHVPTLSMAAGIRAVLQQQVPRQANTSYMGFQVGCDLVSFMNCCCEVCPVAGTGSGDLRECKAVADCAYSCLYRKLWSDDVSTETLASFPDFVHQNMNCFPCFVSNSTTKCIENRALALFGSTLTCTLHVYVRVATHTALRLDPKSTEEIARHLAATAQLSSDVTAPEEVAKQLQCFYLADVAEAETAARSPSRSSW